jgi:hypothetical protein
MAFKFKAKIQKTAPLPFGGVNAYAVVPKKIVSQLLAEAGKHKLPVPVKGTVEGRKDCQHLGQI